MICALVISNEEDMLGYTSEKLIWKEIPLHIYKNIMVDDDFDTSGILLSLLDLYSATFFSDDDRLKLKDEINELIEKQLVTQEEMQDVLKLIQFAIDNHRRVMITPFWHDDIPSAEI